MYNSGLFPSLTVSGTKVICDTLVGKNMVIPLRTKFEGKANCY